MLSLKEIIEDVYEQFYANTVEWLQIDKFVVNINELEKNRNPSISIKVK